MSLNRLFSVCVLVLVLVAGFWALSPVSGGGAGAKPETSNRFTVVHSEGFNLIVTDNQTSTLYFYTIDKDAEVGSDLHLRGSLNLNDVGKATLKPKIVSKK